MTVLNEEWSWDGVRITEYGYNIRALGDPEVVPSRRAENLVIPHKTGRQVVYKYFDERVLTLSMQVRGVNAPGQASSGTILWANMEKLKAMFGAPGLHTLSHKTPDNVVRQAEVEVIQAVEFIPQGPDLYYAMVELHFPNVWWESGFPATVGPTNITSLSQSITVLNEGTYQAEKCLITVHGDISNVMFSTTWEGVTVSVKWGGYVANADTLVIDCAKFEAIRTIGGVATDYTGLITNVNSPFWLPLSVGSNSVLVTATAIGSGVGHTPNVTITFTPMFI